MAAQVPHPEDYVNVLAGAVGSQLGQHHSTGNTLPVAARPWGFNHWAPQSSDQRTSWWFDASADTFYGIRCTHQPSPWIGDYAWFVLMARTSYEGNHRMGFTSYHAEGAIRPWLIDLAFGPDGHRMQLTPTKHGAFLRVTFPSALPSKLRRVCASVPQNGPKDLDEKFATSKGTNTGSCKANGGGIDLESRRFSDGLPEEGSFTFFARLEAAGLKIEEETLQDCWEQGVAWEPMDMPGQTRSSAKAITDCQRRCAATAGCAHFTFWSDGGCHIQDEKAKRNQNDNTAVRSGPPKCPEGIRECCFVATSEQVEVRIGTSFISMAQAQRALGAEVSNYSFASLADDGKALWRRELRRVEVLDSGPPTAASFRRLEIFYTSLYRALLFPRRLDEETSSGIQHWSPYSGQVVKGIGVTDNGFWDTFRTVYPLLAIAYPKELGEMITGWLNAFNEGGWLPKWASPGYRDSMVGTFADVVIADAIIKNISGFSRDVAWKALAKDAFETYPKKGSAKGKLGLKHYIEKGYIPVDVNIPEACSRTLDFAFADAATAAAAACLGHAREAVLLRERSVTALRSLYEPKSGLMGHRKSNQEFVQESPDTWGDCYTEGSAWHHSFPPFNLDVLADLHGGREKLLAKLHELFTVPANFKTGSYKVEIHEMREMRMLGMGQYAHNNQPAHHLAYLFSMLGDHNSTAKLVRQILSRAYSPEGFAGDEDNGEMGSWYVLSAMGLYAPASGVTEDYVLGAVPLFPRIRLLDLDITIEAPSAFETAPVVSGVLWRGTQVSDAAIPYSKLQRGGVLRFVAPGDNKIGQLVSSLRGVLHRAARTVRQSAETAVALPAQSSVVQRPPTVLADDLAYVVAEEAPSVLAPKQSALAKSDDDESQTGWASTILLVAISLGICAGLRAGLRAVCASDGSHTD